MTEQQQQFVGLFRSMCKKMAVLRRNPPQSEKDLVMADLLVLRAISDRKGFQIPKEVFDDVPQEILQAAFAVILGIFASAFNE